MEKKRVLHFIHGLHIGGAESFITNLIDSLENSNEFNFQFVLQDRDISNAYFRKLKELSSENFFFVPAFPFHPISQFYKLKKILKTNSFDAVHIHMNSFVNPIPIIVSHELKIPVIVHSHSTQNFAGGNLGKLIHMINRKLYNKLINLRIACGNEAGNWMFNCNSYTIIHNAINIEKFRYNRENRLIIRDDFKINDETIVIGMVGRLHPVKNHKRAIEIFKEFHSKYSDSKLLIVGDGPLKNELLVFIESLHLKENVIFAGAIDEVSPYYSAMDVLIFPSLFEGLSIAGIEAQASGLKIIASDSIAKEMDISKSVDFISLKESNCLWCEKLKAGVDCISDESRLLMNDMLRNCEYSLPHLADSMSSQYSELFKNK